MYERFTDRSRKVMHLAQQAAHGLNHDYVATEHVLLGLIREGSGMASSVLRNLDVSLFQVEAEILKVVRPSDSRPETPPPDKLPQTPRTKKVIQYAIEEARNLNHNYVGTEHLLLGCLRESEGVAAQILMNLGLKVETVRDEVNLLLNGPKPGQEDAKAVVAKLLKESAAKLKEAIELLGGA